MCTFFIFKRGTFYHFPKRGACAPVPHPSNYTPGVQYTTEWSTQLINGQSEWCCCFHLHQSKCHHQLIEIWGYSSICLGFICNSCFKGAWLSDFLWKVCQRINHFVGSYPILWNVQAEILLAEKDLMCCMWSVFIFSWDNLRNCCLPKWHSVAFKFSVQGFKLWPMGLLQAVTYTEKASERFRESEVTIRKQVIKWSLDYFGKFKVKKLE